MTKSLVELSVCCYEDNTYEILVRDPDTGREVTLTGSRLSLTEEDETFLNEVAPACLWTRYRRVPPKD